MASILETLEKCELNIIITAFEVGFSYDEYSILGEYVEFFSEDRQEFIADFIITAVNKEAFGIPLVQVIGENNIPKDIYDKREEVEYYVPPEKLKSHLEYLKETYSKKKIKELNANIDNLTETANLNDIKDKIDDLSSLALSFGEQRTISVSGVIASINNDSENNKSSKICDTPWGSVNSIIDGLYTQDLVVVGATPFTGKTTTMLNMILHAAMQGIPSIIYSLELSEVDIVKRLVAIHSRISLRAVMTNSLTKEYKERYREGERAVELLPIEINLQPTISPRDIKSFLRQCPSYKIVGLDFLQLWVTSNSTGNEYADITRLIQEGKVIAREFDVNFLMLSQINRSFTDSDDKKPEIWMLKGSGAIEAAADIVLLEHKPSTVDISAPMDQLDMYIRKNRRTGELGDTELYYSQSTKISER